MRHPDSTKALHLCVNCLEPGATEVPVGHAEGSQRDPVQPKLDLCETCKGALVEGDLKSFAERYSFSREVSR